MEGKVTIITGGAKGIGKATSERFAEEGAKVILWDVDSAKGEELAESLRKMGLEAEFFKVNVTNAEEVESAVAKILARYEKIDVLINNAGITKDATLKKMTSEQWRDVIDVNLTGVFNCVKAAALPMLERKSGVILNASSVVGLYGNFGQTNYVATKAGVIGMTKVWARELGRKGVRVNAVAPGFIATEMVNAMPENVLKTMEEKTPLGRLGDPKEIANAYLFLASDEASFINGAVLSVDGGMIP
jgi:3-oxoacyl-[acyl-carrier protein] reductase